MSQQHRLAKPAMGLASLLALALPACSNVMPEWSEVKPLPSYRSFLPANSGDFARSQVNSARPTSAADYVDGQGVCAAGGAPAAAPAAEEPGAVSRTDRGVGLDMTECEVVQAIGQPQSTEIGTNQRGDRSVVMTYAGNERAGIYRFVGGRLTSIERGAEPPPPEKPAKKPPAKRSRTQQPT